MKKRYLLTTEASPDGVIYTFTAEGWLDAMQIQQQNMNLASRAVVVKTLRLQEADFLEWAKGITCTVMKLDDKITFDMFWDKYNDKDRSSKKRSLKLWQKLKEDDQVKAYHYHDQYVKKMPPGVAKKYAETYLAAEQWNN